MFSSKVRSISGYGFRLSKAVIEAAVEHMKENKTPLMIACSVAVVVFILAKVLNLGWLILVAKLMIAAIILDIVIGIYHIINN